MEKDLKRPKLAMCNFIQDVDRLKEMALLHGFDGIDWTFTLDSLPRAPVDQSLLYEEITRLRPLEVRYHCAFNGMDLGDFDAEKADEAKSTFKSVCRLVSKLRGKYMTIHMGLGRGSMEGLHWEHTLESLGDLVEYGRELGVRVCLENLASGWSSRPELFEKLIRKSGAGVTLDIGHARVCHSVESQHYCFEDFVFPHEHRVLNAHIYHEERDETHLPPGGVEDLSDRLSLLLPLPCDWWVLELREENALMTTRRVIEEFLQAKDLRL